MKNEIKTPLIVVAAVAVLGVLAFFGTRAMSVGDLDQGQVKYTPGKPPWLETDPSKKGPGASPGGAPATGTPAANTESHAPPGVGAPTLGNGK